jgi:hypothetical protein
MTSETGYGDLTAPSASLPDPQAFKKKQFSGSEGQLIARERLRHRIYSTKHMVDPKDQVQHAIKDKISKLPRPARSLSSAWFAVKL